MDEKPTRAREVTAFFLAVVLATSLFQSALRPTPPPGGDLVREAVEVLLRLEEGRGQWPYEGVHRTGGEIPLPYRVGGTAAAGTALLYAAPSDPAASAALGRALDFVLDALGDPRLAPSTADVYDVRVWGQASALEFLCRIRAAGRAGRRRADVVAWIPRLARTIVAEEIAGGGWNYAGRAFQASFVTAPVAQALLWARRQGAAVPPEVLDRARQVLQASRTGEGGFAYMGAAAQGTFDERNRLPGTVGRTAACEATLALLEAGSPERLAAALEAFHRHWEELERRRARPGTHAGPYGVAPYYFYFAHRYAAQAIELLPPAARPRERERLLELLLRTRDADGGWNDRVFPRSRAYGTSMAILALLASRVPVKK